jgi:CRP-like cAMP-binding protein
MTTTLATRTSLKSATDVFTLFQQMRTALVPWVLFAEPQWDQFASIFRLRTVRDQEHLLLPGASVDELIFICTGLLRVYFLAGDGAEANKAFIAENEFAGPPPATTLDASIIFGIQALEPTTLLVARYADFVALLDQHPVFGQFQHRLTEWILRRKELRMRSLLQEAAKDRYRDFVERYPELARRVPQYHIASFLGITEVHLSRLRRMLAHEPGS